MGYNKEYYQKNKNKFRESNKKYRSKNKDKVRAYNKKYKKDNPEKIREIRKRYKIKHKEQTKEQGKRHYQKHKEQIKKKGKIYRENNKEKRKDYDKEYQQNNRKVINEKKKRYLKRKRQIDKNYATKYRLKGILNYALKHYTKTGKIYSSKKYGIDYNKIIEHLKPFPKDLKDYEIHHIKPLYTFNFVHTDGTTNLKEVKRAFTPKNHKWLTIEEHKKIHTSISHGNP